MLSNLLINSNVQIFMPLILTKLVLVSYLHAPLYDNRKFIARSFFLHSHNFSLAWLFR